METSNYNPEENLHDDSTKPVDAKLEEQLASDASTENSESEAADKVDKPLPKIHPNLHNNGKYKMFSNHSSSNDIPRTSTGI